MRSLLPVVFLLATLSARAQDATGAKRFAGAWQAKVKDKVVCTIEIQAGEQISGLARDCEIQVNEDGDLVEPDGPASGDKPTPMLNAKIEGDALEFEMKDEGAKEAVKLELRLTGEGKAELVFLDTSVKIKPVRFERKR